MPRKQVRKVSKITITLDFDDGTKQHLVADVRNYGDCAFKWPDQIISSDLANIVRAYLPRMVSDDISLCNVLEVAPPCGRKLAVQVDNCEFVQQMHAVVFDTMKDKVFRVNYVDRQNNRLTLECMEDFDAPDLGKLYMFGDLQ